VAVRVQRHALIFAAPIAISSNQKNAGSLQGSDSRAIHNESVGRATGRRAPNDIAIMSADQLTAIQPASAVPRATSDLSDVIAGLSSDPRTLPCKYFYDERGAALFQKICELPEYYVTRTEIDILDRYRAEIASQIGPNVELIGLGTGAGTKTRILIEALDKPAAYIPVDISEKQLRKSAALFRRIFPNLEVLPVCADYLQPVVLPSPRHKAARNVVYFPGSTIGNFEPNEALEFLRRIGNVSGRGGGLLIGVDLQKDQSVIEAAYNDSAGVTAQFNLNLLARLNREVGADFDLNQWRHRAVYNSEAGRIEMYLISATDQTVHVGDREFRFRVGEKILTEDSYKHTPEGFIALARQAGFDFAKLWTDDARLFGVFYFSCSRGR
jgi:dimethylhistidine N-methyltransferase